jgi:HD-GYP domain-containing protein (c-di-GMP phosphodiesterase class II)
MPPASAETLPLSDILGALSLATDLADGQAQGSAMGATVLATRIGDRMGLGSAELPELYWAALLRFLGCTAAAPEIAAVGFGVEQAVNHAFTIGDPFDADDMRRHLDAHMPKDVPEPERARTVDMIAGMKTQAYLLVEMHCDQARALSRRLPVPKGVADIVSLRHSRWDGQAPMHPSGQELPLNARIMEFAAAMELHRRAGGLQSMVDVARTRAGGQFDPAVTGAFLAAPQEIAAGLGQGRDFELFQSAEPGAAIVITRGEIRRVAEAYADFIDMKSRYYLGHSRKVAGLAYRAALASGVDEGTCNAVFDASLLHDLGKSAIPNGILEKQAPLSRMEEMQFHAFSFHTEQILAMSPVFDPLREMACSVEERCDGSGYHRHIRLPEGSAALIAVANYYDELTRDLPARVAMSPGEAAEAVLAEVSAGRIPRQAARHVLDSAGHQRVTGLAALPDGLTAREAEVLRRLAQGLSTKEIAQALAVSPKTVDNQTQSIFRKIGAKSRTTAALYAMEHGIFSA